MDRANPDRVESAQAFAFVIAAAAIVLTMIVVLATMQDRVTEYAQEGSDVGAHTIPNR